MRSAEVVILATLLCACGGGGKGGGGGGGGVGSGAPVTLNVLPVTVNGALCSAATSAGYPDKPCVSVTLCVPGGGECRTVDDVLLDTGSYGLRVFRQALSGLALPPVASGGGTLATCVQFADQTSDWGPVALADVVLGGEPAVEVPVHVLDATFSAAPASCPGPEADPAQAGLNGILGVGVFREDCGPGCETDAGNGVYFSCTGSSCTGAAVPLASQVQNPVAHLPLDNNGLIVELPAVAAGGVASLDGSVVLGIGTRSNNVPGAVTALPVDPQTASFTTELAGVTFAGSFVDTGSNGLFFAPPPSATLPACAAPNDGWYCPAAAVDLAATSTPGAGGGPAVTVPFRIGNFDALLSQGQVFDDLGGSSLPGAGFDWGLPFHLGRRVVVGIEGSSSSLGTGPLVAY
jgi:hypothetical protein